MSEVRITIDTRQLKQLEKDFHSAANVAMTRLLEAGEEYVRQEAPKRTGRLKGERSAGGSVNSEIIKISNGLRGEINISAIAERRNAGTAEAVSPSGKRRTVRLRSQKEFDYAKVVATGRPRLTAPKKAKAFLIAVQSPPSKGGYLISGGQIYIVRKSVGPQKPNDYPGRALRRLEPQVEPIVSKALKDVLGVE